MTQFSITECRNFWQKVFLDCKYERKSGKKNCPKIQRKIGFNNGIFVPILWFVSGLLRHTKFGLLFPDADMSTSARTVGTKCLASLASELHKNSQKASDLIRIRASTRRTPRTCVKMEPFVLLVFFPSLNFFFCKWGIFPLKRRVFWV